MKYKIRWICGGHPEWRREELRGSEESAVALLGWLERGWPGDLFVLLPDCEVPVKCV